LYSPEKIHLKTNVPDNFKQKARKDIADYYSHCTALDDMVGNLRTTLKEADIDKNTIILFLSDHGDLLGSHGYYYKQQPYDESIRIPVIFYVPEKFGGKPQKKDAMISIEDIMPTILGLCSVEIPEIVDGIDYSKYIKGGQNTGDTVALISCVQPFGQWARKNGGKEYRGLRSSRYTYVKDLDGPWLLFDNKSDPDQLNNLIGKANYSALTQSFDSLLMNKLKKYGDRFLPGLEYVKKMNYPPLDETETVPYH
jgi:arylsulfatase A-like enzyme